MHAFPVEYGRKRSCWSQTYWSSHLSSVTFQLCGLGDISQSLGFLTCDMEKMMLMTLL